MVQNIKWATTHLSRRLGAGLGAQVGAERACVLGVQGARAAGRARRWGGRRWGAQGERARGALAGAQARGAIQVKGAIQIEQANALNYQRKPFNSPYSETYNPGWGKHPNFSWKNEGGPHNLPTNQGPHYPNQGFPNSILPFQNQGPQGFPVNSNQGFQPPNQGNPSPQPYQPPHKRSLEDIVT